MTNQMIKDAEQIAKDINNKASFANARVWSAKDSAGNVTKVRVYLSKGYVDLRADNQAHIETIGRNLYTEAQDAITSLGCTKVFF